MNSLQVVCNYKCAANYAQSKREALELREHRKAEKVARKEHRGRKEALKSKSQWLAEAQTAFNAFIRARDEGEVCISCQKPPKKKNAGHYKSRGAHPELRFNELNCSLQCEYCNSFLSGNQINYRINLINKIGIDNVLWLEGKHEAQHYSVDDAKEIKQYYKEQIKYLEQ